MERNLKADPTPHFERLADLAKSCEHLHPLVTETVIRQRLHTMREQLDELRAVAPSLRMKAHCGGYEDKACVATVTLGDGPAVVGPAEVETVGDLDEDRIRENFLAQLRRR